MPADGYVWIFVGAFGTLLLGEGVFALNKNGVKMGVRDAALTLGLKLSTLVALILGLKLSTLVSNQTQSRSHLFKYERKEGQVRGPGSEYVRH